MIKELKEEYEERVAKKRAELEAAIEEGEVAEPISLTAFFTSLAVSAAISTASYLVSRAFAPKPPKLEQGRLSGSLQLQNSEQGIFIPEIYGAGPTASLVTGSNPTYQNQANVATGANGSITKNVADSNWNAGASHNVALASGDDAFFQFIVGTGYATAGFTTDSSPTSGNTDFLFAIQWNPDGSISIKYSGTQVLADVTHWVTGDTFRVELRSGRFRLYKGSAEIFPQGMIIPSPSYPLYMGIAMQYNGAGISNGKVQINSIGDTPNAGRGGVKVPAIIPWTSGIRKTITTTQQPTGGGKGGGSRTQTVENTIYDIDIALMYAARGPHRLLREYANADILLDQFAQSPNPTGVHDPGVGPDPDYDPLVPPDPSVNYTNPIHRVDNAIALDGDGVGTGNIQGGGSAFAIYPGNDDQQPDPVIEADIDGKYGAGSTTAHKNKFYIRHSQYNLSRWGGIVPNHTAVLEHQTLVTLDDIYASFCERVGVLAANSDHDLSGLSTIQSRGLLVAGRAFAPAEVMDSPEIRLAYNYFVTEAEGQVIGYVEGAEPTVAIADTEIGWLDGEEDLGDIAPEVESILVSEISLPREIHIKSIDPDNEWDLNTQLASRQITEGQAVELLEIQICQLSDERRATAQRALYQRYVAGTAYKFTLSWKYLYLYPGYKITVTRAEGFTHVMRLTSITGGVGVLQCEGIALEPQVFTQPANGIFPPGYIAPQPIPAMTVVSLLDTPLLRDGDETNNNGVGFYMGGVPRTGPNQNWQGFALYLNKNSQWTLMSSSDLPATIGTVVSATGLNTTDTSVIDRTGVITVDLYGTTATLTSVSEEIFTTVPNTNLAIIGSMVIQFATATQVAGFPNRWQLSILLNGRRGTESNVTDTFTGSRFALIDGAIKFVPMEVADIGSNYEYRAVTQGQSLDDAATVDFVWNAEALKPLAPVNLRGTRNVDGDLFMQVTRRSRFGVGMIPRSDVPLGEELEMYDVELLTTGDVLKRTMRVIPGGAQAAVLLPMIAGSETHFSANNVIGTSSGAGLVSAYTKQQIVNSGGWVEATLQITDATAQGVDLELRATNEIGITPTQYYNVHFSIISGDHVLTISSHTDPELFTETFSSSVASIRSRVVVVGSEVRFYWDYIGPGSVPIYVATLPAPLPLTPTFTTNGLAKATSIYIGNNIEGPSVIYSAAQQTEDGFTPNVSSIKVKWYQISSIVGRGKALTGIL